MTESEIKEIQRLIPSINNEDQNTQKEADIPGGNEKKNDELVIEIRKMVERPEIEPSKQCRIYKVPNLLRNGNEEAYTPRVLSIGPFHHKNERLKAMEEHKERYFRSFFKWSHKNWEDLVGVIRDMEESIRGCYEETIDLTSDRFVKMILLDAIFILELFIRHKTSTGQISDDPNVVEPRTTAVRVDLLLLENQLPFFVIEKLYDLAIPSSSVCSSFRELSFLYFGYYNMGSIVATPDVKIEHFTDLMRTFLLPPLSRLPERNSKGIGHLYSATKLHKAGVKFETVKSTCHLELHKAGVKCETVKSTCHLDIKFEKGVLKIPSFNIDTKTEVIARNIIALEQTRYINYAYYTDYFGLLDLLIDTTEDVDLLCDKKILVNYLGDNNSATLMINNLTKSVIGNRVRDDYFGLCEELNGFYENPCHKWQAILKSDYFNSPWKTASTVAAIILLVLTFIQTLFSSIPGLKAK